jgi:hypothetical protein
MDTKLRNILELALRPDTGDGESSAALAAARRLVSKHGMDLLGAPAPERVVYRDKIVYRTKAHDHSATYTLTIPSSYYHSMMERIFLDAQELNCEVHLISCTPKDNDILSGTTMKFKVMGAKANVVKYGGLLESYVGQIRQKQGASQTDHTIPEKQVRKQGWFSKLFGN